MINTVNIDMDINPTQWLADQRVQNQLPPRYVLTFVNLMCYARQLSATTNSEYVDGEFSLSTAFKRVPKLNQKAVDALVDAELVSQVDGDRYSVDFVTPQTTHEQLQASADARARGAKTQQANKAAQKQEQADREQQRTEKRAADAQRQAEHRAKKNDDPFNSGGKPDDPAPF